MIDLKAKASAVLAMLLGALTVGPLARGAELATFRPAVELAAAQIKDQDDGCIWIHPHEPAKSTIIASDKSAGRVFVYDLDGRLLQAIAVTKPGNIDIRQKVRFAGQPTDLVVVNQRAGGFKLVVFRVDPDSRQLERLDDTACATRPNYGGCLYRSAKTGRLFFVCTSETGAVEQYELKGEGDGKVTAAKVRSLAIGKCEGAVADDQSGELFVAEEKKGVWKFSAEPDGPATGELVVRVGEHSLKGDVEGLALFRPAGESAGGYLLVSDQGRSRFMAYRRQAPHEFVGEFAIEGAVDTDGIDVCSANLGPRFPDGVFVCHTGRTPRALLVTACGKIAEFLRKPN
jgi:3-phytase